MIKAVIFDFDGVIINTSEISFKIWNKLFNEAGIDFSMDDYRKFQGTKSEYKIRKILEREGKPDENLVKELTKKRETIKNAFFENISREQLENDSIPGVIDFLNDLKGRNMIVALNTSSGKQIVLTILDKLSIRKHFNAITFAEDVKNSKPDPESYVITSEKIKIPPENCLVFEDAVSGIIAAKNAGMKVIAVNTNNNYDDLKKENPEKIINNFIGMEPVI